MRILFCQLIVIAADTRWSAEFAAVQITITYDPRVIRLIKKQNAMNIWMKFKDILTI